MNRVKLDNLGGLPLTQEILAFLQASSQDALGAIANLAGPLVIITGVTVSGNTNSNGWVAINGELLPFVGGTITGTVGIIETVTQKNFKNDSDNDVLIERVATNVVSGAFNWASFVRLPRLFEMTPPGMLAPYAGATAPAGWLLAQGQEVSRTGYAALFATLGTTYGVGNGTTTFNLPDLRGRVPVGLQQFDVDFGNIGLTGGAKNVALTSLQNGPHTHTVNVGRTKRGDGSNPNHAAASPDGDFFGSAFSYTTQTSGAGEPHNNIQPYITLNYIIKF